MIEYRSVGWKYVLVGPVTVKLTKPIARGLIITTRYGSSDRGDINPFLRVYRLDKTDKPDITMLRIREGYAWDGASGPSVDTDGTMRAALVHDALYQAMRLGALVQNRRGAVDRLFRRHLKEDGVNFVRRWYWYRAVRWFGGSSAQPEADA